jgi:hypothetical protein
MRCAKQLPADATRAAVSNVNGTSPCGSIAPGATCATLRFQTAAAGSRSYGNGDERADSIFGVSVC